MSPLTVIAGWVDERWDVLGPLLLSISPAVVFFGGLALWQWWDQ